VQITFQRLTQRDLPTLAEWLKRPHVAEWWDSCCSIDEVRAQYLPETTRDSAAVPYFAYLDGIPIGFIQCYVAAAAGDGWWPDEHDPGVRGIDQFVAESQHLGQGIGTQMVIEFLKLLFSDPAVTKIQADPAPSNARAIRCYEKAGFHRVGLITTPDGPGMLMVIDRPRPR
jgi:aminoglycoside 6'-N-acetyltransferase Ib